MECRQQPSGAPDAPEVDIEVGEVGAAWDEGCEDLLADDIDKQDSQQQGPTQDIAAMTEEQSKLSCDQSVYSTDSIIDTG